MKPFAITIETSWLGCPHIFHITKPVKYTGCKHPKRWSWESGKSVPVCRLKLCPLPKREISMEQWANDSWRRDES